MVFRSRYVGQGMREDVTIRNFADEEAVCTVQVLLGSDFADLFAVKEGRVGTPASRRSSTVVSPGTVTGLRAEAGNGADRSRTNRPRPSGRR